MINVLKRQPTPRMKIHCSRQVELLYTPENWTCCGCIIPGIPQFILHTSTGITGTFIPLIPT